jgi:hypothetical protein
VVMTEDHGKCTKLFVRIAKKNVKSLLNPGKTVRFTARTVFQSIKMVVVNQKPGRLVPAGFLFCLFAFTPAIAQDAQNTNDIISRMQHDLNLSDDQVAGVTQVVERYAMASADLQKSIDDGTMNPSAVDSQKQQIKSQEEQGISQYLRPDQVYKWSAIEAQDAQNTYNAAQDDAESDHVGTNDTDEDKYSNLPNNP